MLKSCFISDMLNTNNSKNQKWLMPNINTCKCQSFWRSEMSNFDNVNMNCAQYQWFKVPMLTSISLTLINRVEYQLCQSQKWQYHLRGDELCARQQCRPSQLDKARTLYVWSRKRSSRWCLTTAPSITVLLHITLLQLTKELKMDWTCWREMLLL